MYNTGYMRRGGCPTCGGGNNSNFRSNHSPSYFNNRYTNTNLKIPLLHIMIGKEL